MATNSVIEIIGGIDNDGGLNNNKSNIEGGDSGKIYDEDGNEIDPVDLLWVNPYVGNHVYGIVAMVKVAAAAIIWWVVLNGGADLQYYSLWSWAVGLLSVAIAWIPVIIAWALHFINSSITDSIWLYVSLISVDGPMIGYVIAIVIMLMAYFEPSNSGLTYTSEWHYWLGMVLGMSFTALSITFQVLFLPGIRIWHNIRSGKDIVIDAQDDGVNPFNENTGFEESNTVTFVDADAIWEF